MMGISQPIPQFDLCNRPRFEVRVIIPLTDNTRMNATFLYFDGAIGKYYS